MKMLTICSLIAAVILGWQYNEMSQAKALVESRLAEVARQLDERTTELATVKNALSAANARLVGTGGASSTNSVKPQTAPRPTGMQGNIYNWPGPLGQPAASQTSGTKSKR